MASDIPAHAHVTLSKLLHAIQSNASASALVTAIQQQKCSIRSLQKFLQDFAKVDRSSERAYTVCFKDPAIFTKPPIACLRQFLQLYDDHRRSKRLTGRPKVETINEVEEMPLTPNEAASASQPVQAQSLQNEVRSSLKMQSKSAKAESPKTEAIPIRSHKSLPAECVWVQPKSSPVRPTTDMTTTNFAEIMKKVQQVANDGLSKSAHTSVIAGDTSILSPRPTDNFNANIRLYSQWYFSKENAKMKDVLIASPLKCAALPLVMQEQSIIADLFCCFIGLPGDYIMPKHAIIDDSNFEPISFQISDDIDISLRNIMMECLPMASHFSVVQKFTQWSSHASNQMLNALSEALQDILRDYRSSICQLEADPTTNLHKLFYMIRPNMHVLQQITDIITKIAASNLIGGSILTLLYDEITLQTGDPKVQQILINVTERTAQPYIEMLELWLLKGVICDRLEQFCVIDHGITLDAHRESHPFEEFDTARYWESRYSIQPDRIPRFLEGDAGIILRTGKYLNVIRQCGKRIDGSGMIDKKLEFSATTMVHSTFIKQAYHSASKTLLDLLVNENNLMAHISSVKRYFLLQQGDLITQFMDASEEQLSKHVDKVTPLRLDNLLQLIVRMSSAKHDPCLEHLHCDLFTVSLLEQMSKINEAGNQSSANIDLPEENLTLSGLECFAFKYTVQWPVSVVLNQWTLSQYQILFRLLFYCKHVERQLSKVWKSHCEISKKSTKSQIAQWRSAFALRQRMLNAIQHIENYMMIEVIEPNWHNFTEKMRTVRNVDEVMTIHNDFLDVCLQNCMLENPELLATLINMGTVCLAFCKFMQNQCTQQYTNESQQQIDGYGSEFNQYLIKLMNDINGMTDEHTAGLKLLNLVCRINFNGFYSDALDVVHVRVAKETALK